METALVFELGEKAAWSFDSPMDRAFDGSSMFYTCPTSVGLVQGMDYPCDSRWNVDD